jgi:hypothetical protein
MAVSSPQHFAKSMSDVVDTTPPALSLAGGHVVAFEFWQTPEDFDELIGISSVTCSDTCDQSPVQNLVVYENERCGGPHACYNEHGHMSICEPDVEPVTTTADLATSTPGTYAVKYTCVDESTNSAVAQCRTVINAPEVCSSVELTTADKQPGVGSLTGQIPISSWRNPIPGNDETKAKLDQLMLYGKNYNCSNQCTIGEMNHSAVIYKGGCPTDAEESSAEARRVNMSTVKTVPGIYNIKYTCEDDSTKSSACREIDSIFVEDCLYSRWGPWNPITIELCNAGMQVQIRFRVLISKLNALESCDSVTNSDVKCVQNCEKDSCMASTGVLIYIMYQDRFETYSPAERLSLRVRDTRFAFHGGPSLLSLCSIPFSFVIHQVGKMDTLQGYGDASVVTTDYIGLKVIKEEAWYRRLMEGITIGSLSMSDNPDRPMQMRADVLVSAAYDRAGGATARMDFLKTRVSQYKHDFMTNFCHNESESQTYHACRQLENFGMAYTDDHIQISGLTSADFCARRL